MEKINSSGTEDGERLIIKLVITSHSHEFTQIMQMKNLKVPRAFTTHRLGAKTFFGIDFTLWSKLSLQRNIRLSIAKNTSIYKESPPPYLVNFCPQTAKNDGRVSAHPLKFASRTSCRLTFARHFGWIIFARSRIWSTQLPKAWLALVRLFAGRAHVGLCHVYTVYISYVVRFLIMFRRT